MGSMHTGLEEPGLYSGLDEMAEFYAERARGEAGIIVTGGISPNAAGVGFIGASKLTSKSDARKHKVVTDAVHENGGYIAMQILHTGRYGYHYWTVSSSAIKAPIGWSTPKALCTKEVYDTIDDFTRCAVLAKEAGYDGVEIMGSEGYLINQFLVERTNKRTDEWGGSYQNRMRFPIEIVKKTREAVGNDFVIIYRLSMLDLVDGGSSWDEITELACQIEAAGASVINTGIGWHEARIPTIATSVPRGAFVWVTNKLKSQINIPLCTTNRINMPDIAEDILSNGAADLVSMARPFLADPYIVKKSREGRINEINTCIGCNQACLDHVFEAKRASCLVNPRSGYEKSFQIHNVSNRLIQNIAVVGGGPAGLSCAITAAQRGHNVTLFEKNNKIGGQFNLAKCIPGKDEFHETIRYFQNQLELHNVKVQCGVEATADDLCDFNSVVVATGVVPRELDHLQSSPHTKVVSYSDVLTGKTYVSNRVAIIGAGGIGFDVAEYICHSKDTTKDDETLNHKCIDTKRVDNYLTEWGIDTDINKGGLKEKKKISKSLEDSQVYLLQRKKGKLGKSLGKTTGWIHRTQLKRYGVNEMSGCKYVEVNDEGLVIERNGKREILSVDTVVICAGQLPNNKLFHEIKGPTVFSIGGALEASELDAKRAIDQGMRLAANIESSKTGDVYNAPSNGLTETLYKYMKK
jgi:2,4-dienoyl-CoA reductase (NADPH2)